MATLKTFSIVAKGNATTASGTNVTLGANTPSAEIVIGPKTLVRIVPTTASVGVFVRFGPAGTNTCTTSDVYIPYGSFEVFDMGQFNSSICLMSTSASTVQFSPVSRS